MNWLPNFHASGKVIARKSRLTSSVVLRYRRHSRNTGKYSAFVAVAKGLRDSGCSFPLMNRTIRTGTRVIANNDEKDTDNVFVQASGRNILPSWASSRNTGRNDTTMMIKEKNKAGPTCFAASMRMRRRSGSSTAGPTEARSERRL